MTRTFAAAGACALAGWLAAPSAFAQAWASPRGQGSVALALQGIDNTGHVVTSGATVPAGKSRNAAFYLEVEYALTDRLSVSAGVPFVFSRYLGPPQGDPEPPRVQPVDRCYCWHQGLQDFGLTTRVNLMNGATALTASASLGVPSHGYDFVGEAVIGTHLRELRVAVDAGRRLDFVSPRLAVQGRYSYAFVENVLDVPNDRSNASVELVFQALENLSLQAGVSRQITHGGLRTLDEPPPPEGYPWGEITTAELFHEHDRLLRDNSWHLGAGLSYGLAGAEVFLSYVEFVAGNDTHAGRALTLGLSVPFGR